VRVLLVEDAALTVTAIQRFFLLAGTKDDKVIEARTLAKGLELASPDAVDVVLLDLGLPDSCDLGDPLKTLRAFRMARPDLPVVVLTGAAEEQYGRDAISLGAQDFVAKATLDPIALLRTLDYAITRHRFGKIRDDMAAMDAMLVKAQKIAGGK
jgi:DNA-binding NarL/FixJ family response regulator